MQLFSADGPTCLSEHDVGANRPQQGALARHVRARDEQESICRTDLYAVGHAPVIGQERVAQLNGSQPI